MKKALVILVRVIGDGVSDSFSVDLERDPYWLDTSNMLEPGGIATAPAQVELQNFPKGSAACLPVDAQVTSNFGAIAAIGASVTGTVVTVTYASAPAVGASAVVPVTLLF